MKRIEVVAAVIRRGRKVFATQRGYGEFKDWWEFPGGKMEAGESPRDALRREIREELDASVEVGRLLRTVEWDYPAFHLTMHCYWCALESDELQLLEHEAARWLSEDELDSVKWLPADEELLPLIGERLRMPFKTALFDLDGTLFDTEPQYSVYWGEKGRRYRPDIPHFEDVIKGTTLKQILSRYFPDPALQQELADGLADWEAQMHYEFVPGALDFLRDLREHGVDIAIVTSSNDRKMQSVRAQMPEFDSLFDRVLTAEMFRASKPDPDCYLLGARIFGSEIDECVVFEDAFTGLQAGMSSGMLTVGMAITNPRDAIADKCHHVLDDFRGVTYSTIANWLSQR